jgi:nucleotide-binding universal stress UspA family protein
MMKILLAIDGSEGALAAVRHALQLKAQGLKASFVLVNVQVPPTLYEMAVAHDAERLKALRTDAGADLLAPAEALLSGAQVPFESEVAGGEPVNVLLELAENYGCASVFVGARGMGTPQALGLGAVAHGVVTRADLPVTVVHLPAPES